MQSSAQEQPDYKDSLQIDELNLIFENMTPSERIAELYKYYDASEVLFTSSFGTKSVYLINLIHQINPNQHIHFIDTGYHFQETIDYKNELIEKYKLNVIDVLPAEKEHLLTKEEKWWKEHPRMCCTINKIAPLEPIIAQHEVWISGLMANQTGNRSRLSIFKKKGDILKFHPILDTEKVQFESEFEKLKLKRHPLEQEGYGSIGCTHCTVQGEGRSGRWKFTAQKECGLHVRFFYKKE